jgi:hypothetical protein
MNPDTRAAIHAASSAAAAITVLILNQRTFTTIENLITGLSQDIRELRAADQATRCDLKEFFKTQAELDKRLSRIEDKLGNPPR